MKDAHGKAWVLGLAPTDESMTKDLLAAAEQAVQANPTVLRVRRVLGLSQLRAGRLQEAVTTLESTLRPTEGLSRSVVVWPLLAIARHKMGQVEQARRCLDNTEYLLHTHEQAAAAGRYDTVTATSGLYAQEWLRAAVFYVEAKALIDGTEFADEARQLLARWAETAKQQQAADGAPHGESLPRNSSEEKTSP